MIQSMLALTLCMGLTMGTVRGVAAQEVPEFETLRGDQGQPFTINGTALRIIEAPSVEAAKAAPSDDFDTMPERSTDAGMGANTRYALLVTADITGEPQIIWLDLSWLKDSDFGDYIDLENGEAIQVEVIEQPRGSFLAIQYWELVKGSTVNNTDWGISESYTTRDDSINARVDNGPDDDEARRQGNKFDEKGRRVKKD